MDERTLNDLLECSVCLERLDTSSKVLPCQHTFCRKCLEVIVASRQELRCPECRILVDVKIEELPPNVLLMRILEGMKNSSNNQQNLSKPPKNVLNSNAPIPGIKDNETNNEQVNTKNTPGEIQTHQPNEQCNNSTRRIVPHAFALYDFVSTENGDLNFKKGDIILLKRKMDANWFVGEINGREGSFPINYVQIIVPLPTPQCVALYDFKMGPNEAEGCLTFKKGAIINVIRRIDHHWAEGRINSYIGIFPIAFVEMNSLAKRVLDSGHNPHTMSSRCLPPVPYENNSTDTSSTVTSSPNSTCSSNTTSSNSAPSSPTSNSNSNSPQHNQPVVKNRDMKEKRHSLNSISANTNLSIVSSNRHSAEILSVPDPVESTSSSAQNSDSANASVNLANTRPHDLQSSSHLQQQQKTPRINILKTTANLAMPQLPWAYVALYPYKPRKADELELKKGCVYFVTERCLDGWYKGKNWADKSGVFPGNYVTPLRNRDQQQVMHQRKLSNVLSHTQQVPTHGNHVQQNQNTQDTSNSHLPTMHPPELPPRSTTNTSVWAKPLGQHVEAFFHRKSSPSQQRNENNSQQIETAKATPVNHPNNAKDSPVQHQYVQNRDKDKKESSSSAVSLMKRLTNMKRSKSPTHAANTPNVGYSMDNPVFEDSSVNPTPSSSKLNISMSHPVHVRSGSCPSQLLQSLPVDMGASSSSADPNAVFGSQRIKGHKERPSLQSVRQQMDTVRNRNPDGPPSYLGGKPLSSHKQLSQAAPQPQPQMNIVTHHRKSQSLDANTIAPHIPSNSPNNNKPHGVHGGRESRFRCIVSYPPNSDLELELNVGDIVFVHRKQKNGWYKGTHARTNKTGLFPASFVEPDI